VLVAEDNVVNQKVILGILDRAGHTAYLVKDGEAALDALTSQAADYDVAILDMNMPHRSGIEVLQAFRFFDPSAALPVMMVTADATPQTMEACLKAGADAYITKPLDAHELLDRLAALAERRRPVRDEQTRSISGGRNGNRSCLDTQLVDNLVQLGGGKDFVAALLQDFRRDGQAQLAAAEVAADAQNYLDYREALHAIKSSASELGGVELVQQCSKAEQLKAYDMSGPLPVTRLAHVEEAYQ